MVEVPSPHARRARLMVQHRGSLRQSSRRVFCRCAGPLRIQIMIYLRTRSEVVLRVPPTHVYRPQYCAMCTLAARPASLPSSRRQEAPASLFRPQICQERPNAVRSAAQEWCASYKQSHLDALSSLLSLLVQAAGIDGSVTSRQAEMEARSIHVHRTD